MRLTLSVLIVAAIVVGCSDQRGGRFVTQGASSVALQAAPGFLTTVHGYPLREDGTADYPRNLLYVLVVCPGLTTKAGGGSETQFHPRIDTYISSWETSVGKVSVPVRWDKREDTLNVGAQTLGRGTGNVFIVRRERSGALSATQLPSVDQYLQPVDAVQYIQRQMSNDTIVTSIRLAF